MNLEQETSSSASPKSKREIGNVTHNITMGGLVMTVVAYIIQTAWKVDLPADVVLAVATLINMGVGFLTRSDMRGKHE